MGEAFFNCSVVELTNNLVAIFALENTSMSNCIYCFTVLPTRGTFCHKCGKQIKCTACSEFLEKDANACVICGHKVGENMGTALSPNVSVFANTFELNEISESRENKASRSIKVSCSDDAVANFSDFIEHRIKSPQFGSPASISQNGDNFKKLKSGEVVREFNDTVSSRNIENPIAPQSGNNDESDVEILHRIFRRDGQSSWKLYEIALGATGKLDYAKRLTFLFLYLYELEAKESTRIDLKKILEDSTVYDTNFRTWLANEPGIGSESDALSLNAAGRRNARESIKHFLENTGNADQWLPGSTFRKASSKTTPKATDPESKKSTGNSGKRNPPTTEIVSQWNDLGLNVDGHKAFASRSDLDKALLGLWAIRKATSNSVKEVSSKQLKNFLFTVFELNVHSRSLENALKSTAAKGMAVKIRGTTFQILPPGNEHINKLFGIK